MGVNNRVREWSRGVIKNPEVLLTLRDPIPRAHWNRFPCLIETTEAFTKISKPDPAVSLILQDLIPWSHWHCRIRTFQRLSEFSRQKLYHMRHGLSPWIKALGGIVWWKKPRVENPVTLSISNVSIGEQINVKSLTKYSASALKMFNTLETKQNI
jgi:hypothetical protein